MKKTLGTLAGVALLALSGQVFADEASDVGKKIYDRAFGRGCGTCHDQAQNPQLAALIKGGQLDRAKFGEVITNGKNGMPAALAEIMKIGPVKKAGYTEEQALDALYKYLSE